LNATASSSASTPFIAVHTYALLGPALGLARGGYADFAQWTTANS
jgi:hypothetical protein